jgi:hypothetical protein
MCTVEHEANNKLPFLDTCVVRRKNGYNSTIYRKKTFTGVYLNWTSLTARRYKIGLINCLAERIWRIVSDEDERLIEIEKLKLILVKNDYPTEVIDQTISKFIEKKTKNNNIPVQTVEKMKRFLKLPYVNRKCEDFAFRLKQLVESNYTQVDFNVAFQAPMTIGKLFPFKDNIKKVEERSMVVYKLRCATCGATYIGKKERILYYRMKEHQDEKKDNNSACKKHIKANRGHRIAFENVEVLDSADNDLKLRIKELLHILTRKPELNKQLGSQSSFEIKTLLIQAYPQFRSK